MKQTVLQKTTVVQLKIQGLIFGSEKLQALRGGLLAVTFPTTSIVLMETQVILSKKINFSSFRGSPFTEPIHEATWISSKRKAEAFPKAAQWWSGVQPFESATQGSSQRRNGEGGLEAHG